MEVEVRARRFGGSIGVILPREVVEKERISENDTLKMRVDKIANLSFLWGLCKNVKISTDVIMKEIDEGEDE